MNNENGTVCPYSTLKKRETDKLGLSWFDDENVDFSFTFLLNGKREECQP